MLAALPGSPSARRDSGSSAPSWPHSSGIALAFAAGLAGGTALTLRGVAPDAVALFDAPTLAGTCARGLAESLGEAGAVRILVGVAFGISAAVLAAVGMAAVPGAPRRRRAPWPVAALLLSAPAATGTIHGDLGGILVGPAAAALVAWRGSDARGLAITALLAPFAPVLAASGALAGFALRPGLAPLVAAILAASLGGGQASDVRPHGALDSLRNGLPTPETVGLLVSLALLLTARGRLRIAGLLASVLALGPLVVFTGDLGYELPVPLPAFPLASLGAGSGWAAAGAVAAAALAIAWFEAAPFRGIPAFAVLIVAESVALLRVPAPALPPKEPQAVASLAERSGLVLQLPLAIYGKTSPEATVLWKHRALLSGRSLYHAGDAVRATDAVLGDPGVIAVLSVLDADAGWLVPNTDAGSVLRGLGITELALDRAAVPDDRLVLLDPVLARLYGAPQRDAAGEVDLWRIDPIGARSLPPPPYFRRSGEPGTQGWRTVESLLTAGRNAQGSSPSGL